MKKYYFMIVTIFVLNFLFFGSCSRKYDKHIFITASIDDIGISNPRNDIRFALSERFTIYIFQLNHKEASQVNDLIMLIKSDSQYHNNYQKVSNLLSKICIEQEPKRIFTKSAEIVKGYATTVLPPGNYAVLSSPNSFSKLDVGWSLWEVQPDSEKVVCNGVKWVIQHIGD